MYESKIFAQRAIQWGADSTAPERKTPNRPHQDQRFCRKEANLNVMCALGTGPGLGPCPGDSYWQTLLDCDIIKISVSVCWGLGKQATDTHILFIMPLLCLSHCHRHQSKHVVFLNLWKAQFLSSMSPICLSLQTCPGPLWSPRLLFLPTSLGLGTQGSKWDI